MKFVLLILISILLLGCTPYKDTFNKGVTNMIKEEESTSTSFPTTFTEIDLQLSKAPLLGEIASLNATIMIIQEDVVNVKFIIELPPGFESVNGDLSWEGDIIIPNKTFPPFNEGNPQAKTSLSLISYIKAVKEGNWTIIGTLSDDGTTTNKFQQHGRLYISVSENNSSVSEFPFPKPAEPCAEMHIDGELVRCTTSEPTGEFVETQLP